MNCQDARRLLDQGVTPGTANPQRATLGFHLSGCADCRVYHKKADELLMLRTLLAQPLRAPHAPATTARQHHVATRSLRVAGAALLIGGALAVMPWSSVMPTSAMAAKASRAPAVAAGVRRSHMLAERTAQSDDALLRDLLKKPAMRAASRVDNVRKPEAARTELAPGQQLVIPALPAADLATTQAAPAEQPRSYVVKPGDSLWAIAQQFYGNGVFWTVIYNANAGMIGNNPNLIYPDQRFSIPNPPPLLPPPQTGRGPGSYTIVSGDTLSGIAFRAYGNANLWPTIYNANRGVIGANPNLIYPGTVLSLP